MDLRERYLSNPHINLDEKRKRLLGITTQELFPAFSLAPKLDNFPPKGKGVNISKSQSDGHAEPETDGGSQV